MAFHPASNGGELRRANSRQAETIWLGAMTMLGFLTQASESECFPVLLLVAIAAFNGSACAQQVAEIKPAQDLEAERALQMRKQFAMIYLGDAARRNDLETAIATAVHHGLQLGKFNDDDEDQDVEKAALRLQLEPDVAASVFNTLLYENVFNADDGARQRLESILRQKINFIDRMCGLSQELKEKLLLAGSGDIERLFDRVESQRHKFVAMTGSKSDGAALGAVIRETNTLRNPLNSGSLQDNSLFANVLRKCLTPEQVMNYTMRRARLSPALRKTVPHLASAK